MKDAGYATHAVGKWHLGLVEPNTPIGRGFDFFKGYLGDMMDDYYNHRRHGVNYMTEGRKRIEPKGHATDLFSDWAVKHIKERDAKEEPFFLFLSYNAPHTPIQPPEDWYEKVKKREKGIGNARAKLVALIEHMDDGIGKVLKAVPDKSNTIIVFTSDNGGQANVGARNDPWKGEKQQMWEGGLRVPTCIVWPGHVKAGSRYEGVSMTMDWLPTLAELAGASVPEGIEGLSLLDGIRGKNDKLIDSRSLIWVRREGGRMYRGQDYYAVRQGPWKLLQNTSTEPFQLYNLELDPGETSPVADNIKVRRDLEQILREHVRNAGFVPWQGRVPDLEKVE